MTAPRRALLEPPEPIWQRGLKWFRTSWVPAAILSVTCLLAAGLWPRAAPPQVSAPPQAPVPISAPAAPPTGSVHVPSLHLQRDDAGVEISGPSAQPDPATAAPVASHPQLRISRLGIAAPLDPVGTVGNEVEIPDDPSRVGHWVHGALPDDTAGTVLVTGHVTWNGQRGALWPLASARTGDLVEIDDTVGGSSHWIVTGVTTLPRDAEHPDLFSTEGNHRLVVVTCGGPIVAGQYRDLVVVEAAPIT